MEHYDIIRGPVVTEKTTLQKELNNQVTIIVDKKANRVEIKNAVEKSFNTKVKQVRTLQVKGKVKQRGRIIGKRKDWKKAVVTLMPGQRIDFFEGV
ncbi:MAG: 50S ribosomal protein L23 [Desulfobacula sp.]|jgi:large subunit ribosomal protein L23|uniref:50S ribosomal protein L23 n=1 Tax=Desulfobacula sp. TaxID=2593537 RepID=UPI001D1D1DE2|nr:50S ribosomal protein L23 [Desulfobacula sp.]MBT3484814.1 50S ribosomal protein L23 [Desulfobacula sp.]MBT3804716.1 50S ribosomal protein L23 [Desulfobacula sp.]MBT4024066.1 50S ribosomal protein L23 [Desulfobacula sp.]MBT4198428.1 50S ribosomal protein L23 [Desulfobacula sp.]